MKNLIVILFIFFPLSGYCQVQDTISEKRIVVLEQQIKEMQSRSFEYARANNSAGICYLLGLALGGINLTLDNPKDELYIASGALLFTGTITLYFSANKLKVNKYRRRR